MFQCEREREGEAQRCLKGLLERLVSGAVIVRNSSVLMMGRAVSETIEMLNVLALELQVVTLVVVGGVEVTALLAALCLMKRMFLSECTLHLHVKNSIWYAIYGDLGDFSSPLPYG